MELDVLPGKFAVCRLPPDAEVPEPQAPTVLWSVTRTATELSLVCSNADIPQGCLAVERGWRGLVVAGTLDFSLIGILASLTGTLAAANISLFALSTYDTDYLLVKEDALERAIIVLDEVGHSITYKEIAAK